MLAEIAQYLYEFKDNNWHELNSFLKSNYGDDPNEIRVALVKLDQSNRIKIKDDKHLRLNNFNRINEGDATNTYTTLDNWIMEARLTLEEREKMDLANKSKEQIIYQPVFNGPANAVFGNGDFKDIQQTLNDEPKKSDKPKWLTLTFYKEELVKHWFKLFLVAAGVFLYKMIETYNATDKSSGKQEQKQITAPKDTTSKKDTVVQ
jgi:hypothetical protein